MLSADDALARLKQGNQDFVNHIADSDTLAGLGASAELIQQQQPFAVILGCSDSRVPAEIVFNQGLGDLFVIRVAGNIVAPSLTGSIEYAAEMFGTRLVVVLGHTQCGAVKATVDQLQQPTELQSPNLRSIVDQVRPAVDALLDTELRHDHSALAAAAVRANVEKSVDQLRHSSAVLENLIETDGLKIVGAEYSVETGAVDFFSE
ncbi:carbonic anhydrase [Salinisphaera sp.]|uniref:carbonic anhydrase n=1 Tax=Salinisphaera sp. TaxID=1914330 RepID=UPI002D793AC0|nr:carbonic anhydrase [Salinisphaera sp.]HET7314599.1 carbonic anhydrase [Salinisphaera sp.]